MGVEATAGPEAALSVLMSGITLGYAATSLTVNATGAKVNGLMIQVG
jgi:hypothetical protein